MKNWHHDQIEFILQMQGFQHRKMNVIHHMNRTKENYHMIISIDGEKHLTKICHPIMIKGLSKLRTEG